MKLHLVDRSVIDDERETDRASFTCVSAEKSGVRGEDADQLHVAIHVEENERPLEVNDEPWRPCNPVRALEPGDRVAGNDEFCGHRKPRPCTVRQDAEAQSLGCRAGAQAVIVPVAIDVDIDPWSWPRCRSNRHERSPATPPSAATRANPTTRCSPWPPPKPPPPPTASGPQHLRQHGRLRPGRVGRIEQHDIARGQLWEVAIARQEPGRPSPTTCRRQGESQSWTPRPRNSIPQSPRRSRSSR